ncbi:MAG: FAD-dependent oxidoreductase [Planctomycetes bacterium]|nr:FAD-dependent oxidoreductase [Planctomycetota bacterium]
MPRLTIDNREVEVADNATILDAAGKLGIEIPAMCFLKGHKPSTSCMVCAVKVEGQSALVPACGTIAGDGMRVRTNSDQVREARKAALELLLSDHLGDCMGPCQTTCPARMNIPLMIRQIAAGKLRDAIATVKKDIALPAVLGRICPKPCERSCRRAAFDDAVSICLLKRYVADVDLESALPYSPQCKPKRGKRVAIVGAGPAGLAAAYYLQQNGFDCTLFDDHEEPGGMLRYAVPADELPREVLDKEIALIIKLGVEFRGQTTIGAALSMADLRKDFDAVFLAVGGLKPGDAEAMGLETGQKGIAVDAGTYQTNLPGVFAGGDAVRRRKLTVRAVADGKEAAASIGQYLSGQPVTGPARPFNTRIGRLKDGEIEVFLANAGHSHRVTPTAQDGGFSDEQARDEAARCLHCDCRKPQSCKLRRYAKEYDARATRYQGPRRLFAQQLQHPELIYESGKCIDCGLCIQIAAEAGEKLGLTFIGRGFDVRVAVPFDRSIAEGLQNAASRCVEACPTGALAFKD